MKTREKKQSSKRKVFSSRELRLKTLKTKTLSEIENFHKKEPLKNGILRETLREKIFAHLPPEIFRSRFQNLETEKKIASEKDFVRAAVA